ncbi:MAG: hypothetical protein ACK5U6_17385 [Pseudanabaena sp.]|jgi:hypothetical protein
MTNALDLALANAASNMPKGEELHLENLDSIADPTIDKPLPILGDHVDSIGASVLPKPFADKYNEFMQEQYQNVSTGFKGAYLVNDPEQDGLLLSSIKVAIAKVDLANIRLDALADMITAISNTNTAICLTIEKAASMSSEPNHKHRSLHEWDDSALLNELVERENDLMPFYYELLKRIGSPELQSLVMSSMQGKNASMVTLAQLCSALAPKPINAQSSYQSSSLAEDQMAKLQQMSAEEANHFAQQMNTVVPKAPYPTRSQPYNPYSAS